MFILAVTHHGEKLRDTNIAVSMFDTSEEAVETLRDEFADDIAEGYPDDSGVDTSTEEGLLDALRWHHNVIATITVVEGIAFSVQQVESWAGVQLVFPDELLRLEQELQHSTLPDTVGTVVSSWDEQ